jgi:O-antigen/teichoic acid export membrane protein
MGNKRGITEELFKNSFWNFGTTFANRIGALFFTILVARFLLPELFGVYNLIIAITFIFLTLSDFGVNTALLKYFSEHFGNNNVQKAKAYLNYLSKLKISLLLFFSIVLLSSAYFLAFYVFQKPLLFIPLLLSSFYLVILGLEEFYSFLFYPLNKVNYRFYKEVFFQALRIILLFLITISFVGRNKLEMIMLVLILSSLLVLLFVLLLVKKIFPKTKIRKKFSLDKQEVLRFIKYLAIGGLSLIFFSNIDIIMLGIFISDTSYVGFYRAAFSIVAGISGLLVFSNLLLPAFVRVKKNRINIAFNKVVKFICMLSIPATFGIIVLGKYVIRFLYGYEYLLAVIPLYILAFVIVESGLTGAYYSLLVSKNKPQMYVKSLVGATLINFILNFVLILSLKNISEIWAVVGATIATVFSRYFYLLNMVFLSKKYFKLKFNLSYILKPIGASFLMALIMLYSINLLGDINLFNGLFEIFLGIVAYFIFLFLIKGIEIEDFVLVKQIFYK